MPLPIRPAAKNWLRRRYRAASIAYIHWRNPFDVDDLVGALRHLGVREGDKLLVHSSFQEFEGFRGSALDAVRGLQRAVGSSGLLVMPTLPFAGSRSGTQPSNGSSMSARHRHAQASCPSCSGGCPTSCAAFTPRIR